MFSPAYSLRTEATSEEDDEEEFVNGGGGGSVQPEAAKHGDILSGEDAADEDASGKLIEAIFIVGPHRMDTPDTMADSPVCLAQFPTAVDDLTEVVASLCFPSTQPCSPVLGDVTTGTSWTQLLCGSVTEEDDVKARAHAFYLAGDGSSTCPPRFGWCYRFYEPYFAPLHPDLSFSSSSTSNASASLGTSTLWFIPRVMCVLSSIPAMPVQQAAVRLIVQAFAGSMWQHIQGPQWQAPPEVDRICRGLCTIPLPTCGITALLPLLELQLTRPAGLRRFDETMHWLAATCLPTAMSICPADLIVDAMACLLLERKLVLVGGALGWLRVSRVSLALLSLLSPLQWVGAVMPVLPTSFEDIIAAPTPILVGVLQFPSAAASSDDESLSVLDLPKLKLRNGVATTSVFANRAKLVQTLQPHFEERVPTAGAAAAVRQIFFDEIEALIHAEVKHDDHSPGFAATQLFQYHVQENFPDMLQARAALAAKVAQGVAIGHIDAAIEDPIHEEAMAVPPKLKRKLGQFLFRLK